MPAIALIVCIIAVLSCAVVFPEVILTGKTSFLMWADHITNYTATFNLTTYFYQGGIQLWSFFGQMPTTYFYMTFGMFKFQNIMTALTYFFLSPLALDSGQFFHRVFAFVDVVSLLLLNVIGTLLLLKHLTNNRWILILGAPVFGLFFCAYAFVDDMFFQDILPLAMYLILRVFETFRWRYIVLSGLLLAVSLQHGIIHTFYSHVALNFFFLSCLGWALVFKRPEAGQWWQRSVKEWRQLVKPALCCLALMLVMIAPYIYIQLFSLKDIEFGLSTSRLHNLFDAHRYFHVLPWTAADYKDLFRRMMDFTFISGETAASCSYFVGYLILFLSIVGMTMSRNSKKWIFFTSIVLMWLVNFPRTTVNWGTPVHWLNIITNPTKSMVRTYEMITLGALPYFLIALAVLGILALLEVYQKKTTPQTRGRAGLAAALITAFIAISYPFEPPVVQHYLLFAFAASMTAFALIVFTGPAHRRTRQVAAGMFILLALTDIAFSAYQTKMYIAEYCTVRPHQIGFMKKPKFIYIDYQNPKIIPFIERIDNVPFLPDPVLWSTFDLSPTYTHAINRNLSFQPYDGHAPRPAAYRSWIYQPYMKDYVAQNNRLFFFVPYGVQNLPGTTQDIIYAGLTGDVVALDASGPGILPSIPKGIKPTPIPPAQWVPDVVEFKDYYQHFKYKDGIMIWDFPLSRPLPRHAATTAFSSDVAIRFLVQFSDQKTVEFEPAQGGLVAPWTFDAQNIKEGKVYVALPMDRQFMDGAKAILLVKDKPEWGVQSVLKHQGDQTGFVFKAPIDGWLVIHYPYDKKWVVTVDNKPVQFYKANDSFMAIPVKAGNQNILIQYWPGCWLRWGLWVSAIAAIITLFWIIGTLLREEKLLS